ncbi:caspase family protein [Tenacibaculum soleae]|uniref:caspase family protein n=1 Tax=Tenacibaculum soleae TaxID=447689 RepID=UPI0026E39C91|nr:caspase family protein [Tenacibaculum soleae]MDO6813997.1 caspase family protein [Tenacibaculum soleae]
MNLGIIIGVSEYSDSKNNLPGCKLDSVNMNAILSKSNKYDDILLLNEKMTSAELKEKLTGFISDNQKNEIEELFFYFTGHGEFHSNEFYYLLSDFDTVKRKQTTLQNDEVDTLIKTLNPNLVIKVIDACQSGKSYIKEYNAINKYFEKTGTNFNNCYFLNSSLSDQYSYQTKKISDFTLSFIESIKKHQSKEIRYKDIIDYISDEFASNTDQTPFFVIQANLTEKFCQINPTLKEHLNNLDFDKEEVLEKKENLSLIDKIKKEAENYCSKEQAIEVINRLKIKIEEFELTGNLEELYDLEVLFYDDYSPIIKKNTIAKWLENNDHEYFANASYKRVRKDRYTNPLAGLTTNLNVFGTGLTVGNDDYETIRDGFNLDIEVPYKTIVFNLNSRFPNVDSFTTRIIYLISKRQIGFFYFITNFEEKNWEEKELNSDIEWFTSEEKITDEEQIENAIKTILEKLKKIVNDYLKETFEAKEK